MDDRDHYGNKRLDLAGPLLGTLFRQLFKRLSKDVKSMLTKVCEIAFCLYKHLNGRNSSSSNIY
jgi:DNA-directed RNA polymerase beta subunit